MGYYVTVIIGIETMGGIFAPHKDKLTFVQTKVLEIVDNWKNEDTKPHIYKENIDCITGGPEVITIAGNFKNWGRYGDDTKSFCRKISKELQTIVTLSSITEDRNALFAVYENGRQLDKAYIDDAPIPIIYLNHHEVCKPDSVVSKVVINKTADRNGKVWECECCAKMNDFKEI